MLAFCDTETTGFYVDAGHEAWEVAVIVERGGNIVEQSWQLPVDVSKADPQALAMNGWYTRSLQHKRQAWLGGEQRGCYVKYGVDLEMVAGLTPLGTFANEFMTLVQGCTLIGAVPSFDERFVTKALRAGGGLANWHYQPVDVETLAAGFVIGQADIIDHCDREDSVYPMRRASAALNIAPEYLEDRLEAAVMLRNPRWDSEVLSRLIGVDPDLFERHSALGDCRWALQIWEKIMGPVAALDTLTQKGA